MDKLHEDRVRVPKEDLKLSPERWAGESLDLLTAYLSGDPATHAGALTFAHLTDLRQLACRISDAARRWGLDEEKTVAVLTAFYIGYENGKTEAGRDGQMPDWKISDLCKEAAMAAGRGGDR